MLFSFNYCGCLFKAHLILCVKALRWPWGTIIPIIKPFLYRYTFKTIMSSKKPSVPLGSPSLPTLGNNGGNSTKFCVFRSRCTKGGFNLPAKVWLIHSRILISGLVNLLSKWITWELSWTCNSPGGGEPKRGCCHTYKLRGVQYL